jgi:5'-nucleotidase
MLAGYGAFPFIRRFLAFNQYFPEESLVERVLLSRNSAVMGLRVFRSIVHDELDITGGASPFPYIPAFNTPLFFVSQ